MRADHQLREELDYCVPRGIPHSVFTGRVVGPQAPEWSETDRALALAWQQDKAATCSCGTRADEWDEDRDAYVGDTTYCRGHDLLAMQQEALPKDEHGRPLPGFIPHLIPRKLYAALHPDPAAAEEGNA